MKIIKSSNNNNNYIATVAIGEKHYREWKRFILPSWKLYCEKNDLGLVVFTEDLIDKSHSKWKKANWHRLLMGDHLKKIQAKNTTQDQKLRPTEI